MSNKTPLSDVLVIGGGVIGLSTAYQLANEGLRVTLLEKNACGREASWAGAGVLQAGHWTRHDPLVYLLRASLRRYPAFTSHLHERTGIDPQYVPCGSFDLLLEDQQYRMALSEVEAARELRDEYQCNVLETLTPQQAREIEPRITHDLLGVKFCPITCQVQNPLLLQALRAACLLEKVNIIEQCEVREVLCEAGRATGVQTMRDRYAADHVVLAAGAWSSLIKPNMGEMVPVYPVRGQILLLETRERLFTHIIERGKCYMVPRLDGRTLVGATEEHESGYEKCNTAEGIHTLLSLAQRLVPRLAEARIARMWSGLRPATPDRSPYIGQVPDVENLWAATGHFRSGLILAPITAQIIADLIIRGETTHNIKAFAPGRPIKLPQSVLKQRARSISEIAS
jgi:glycine oxidase